MNADRHGANGSTDGSEDDHRGEPGSSQAELTHGHALLERVRQAVPEINGSAEMVARTLGGEGLTLRADGDRAMCGRVLPPKELSLDDEEARPGRDGSDRQPVRGQSPHAGAPQLGPIRSLTSKTQRASEGRRKTNL